MGGVDLAVGDPLEPSGEPDMSDRSPILDALETRIGHRFADRALLERALTHTSAVGSAAQSLAISGTGLLIVVSVALESLRQLNSRALMVTYDEYK